MPQHSRAVTNTAARTGSAPIPPARRWARRGTAGLLVAVVGYAAAHVVAGMPRASTVTGDAPADAAAALIAEPAQMSLFTPATATIATHAGNGGAATRPAETSAPTAETSARTGETSGRFVLTSGELARTRFDLPVLPTPLSMPLPTEFAAVSRVEPATGIRDARTAGVTWQPTTAPAKATAATAQTPAPTAASTTATASNASTPARPESLVASGVNADGRVAMTLNRTVEIKTKNPVHRVSVGQPEIADVQPFATNILLVTAKKPGTTQVIVWDDQDNSQSIDVSVEIPLDQLKDLIGRVAPGAEIEVAVANDQIVLRGQAPDLGVAKRVSDLAGAYGKVQNFIEVAGAQTVAVQVQFAEVSRNVTNDLGVSWAYQNGTSIFGSDPGLSGQLGYHTSGPDDVIDGIGTAKNPGQFNIFGLGSVSGNPFAYFIKALRDNSMLRVLQEPTLTTTSGEPASFLAGGQVPVPVPADNGNVAIEYKEFGVRLKLTPVVLGNGKIRLVMEAESSELDYANGTTITGAAVPGIRTRRVQNTVELGEGQTISVAGLLDDSVTASKRSVPLLGDIPVLGQLFRSTRYQRRETELVILITPRLSGAMNPDQVTPLPGAGWRHPNELEQFAFGDMGGNAEADAVKDWNKPASERGLKPGETQRNTTRALEPASITRSNPRQPQPPLGPPPTFLGEHGYAPPEERFAGTPVD